MTTTRKSRIRIEIERRLMNAGQLAGVTNAFLESEGAKFAACINTVTGEKTLIGTLREILADLHIIEKIAEDEARDPAKTLADHNLRMGRKV